MILIAAFALVGPLTFWLTRTAGGQPIIWCARIGAYHPANAGCRFEHVDHPGIAPVGKP